MNLKGIKHWDRVINDVLDLLKKEITEKVKPFIDLVAQMKVNKVLDRLNHG